MYKVFDFKCDKGHVTEKMVDANTSSIHCPECGELATKQLAAPMSVLEGVSGAFPGAAMKWDKAHSARLP